MHADGEEETRGMKLVKGVIEINITRGACGRDACPHSASRNVAPHDDIDRVMV
jgi:hypothetical protein